MFRKIKCSKCWWQNPLNSDHCDICWNTLLESKSTKKKHNIGLYILMFTVLINLTDKLYEHYMHKEQDFSIDITEEVEIENNSLNWHKINSEIGWFEVKFPAIPNYKKVELSTNTKWEIIDRYYYEIKTEENNFFKIMYVDYPKDIIWIYDNNNFLQIELNIEVSETYSIASKNRTKYRWYDALEYTAEDWSDLILKGLIIINWQKVYSLSYRYPKWKYNEEFYKYYLNSLKIN